MTVLRTSSSETYRSAARNVSAWNVLSVTPNCLRVLRYSTVSLSAVSIAPSASWQYATWARATTSSRIDDWSSYTSPSGVAGVPSNVTCAARPPSNVR